MTTLVTAGARVGKAIIIELCRQAGIVCLVREDRTLDLSVWQARPSRTVLFGHLPGQIVLTEPL